MFDFFKRRRREAIRSRPFARLWREIIDQDVPLVRNLKDKERHEHEYLVAVFLEEKRFEGCGGRAMTEGSRVSPHAHQAQTHGRAGQASVVRPQARAGEAWAKNGLLILAWDEVQRA